MPSRKVSSLSLPYRDPNLCRLRRWFWQGITDKGPKKETKLVTKLRRARNTTKARNVNGFHEDVHSDGSK